MWIDTHCHLDASEFSGQGLAVADQAVQRGVSAMLIPAVHVKNFNAVAQLAQQHDACFYALGIHPLFVPTAKEEDLQVLYQQVHNLMTQTSGAPDFVAIGEIGLDYFVPALTQSPFKEKQEYFYVEQLKIAKEFDLPVILHVRRSQDQILKQLRRFKLRGGIAHAFNGSLQQAQHFIDLGFKLGFGGAMTFTRALQIRRLAQQLPLEAIVLETDAPDIAPSWFFENTIQNTAEPATGELPAAKFVTDYAGAERRVNDQNKLGQLNNGQNNSLNNTLNNYNSPQQIPRIAEILAQLRQTSIEQIARQTCANAFSAVPRMQLSGNFKAAQLLYSDQNKTEEIIQR